MDYLPPDEVQALYDRHHGGRQLRSNRAREFINKHFPLLLVGLGVLLFSAALFMSSFLSPA